MANYVTISTLGPGSVMANGLTGQAAVDKMIEHWDNKLKQVLPDAPDLIVVPEACDRFCDVTGEDRKEYYKVRGNQLLDFFSQTAKDNKCYIAYSAARQLEDGTWRNSTQLIDRTGNIAGIYNKNHLVVGETTENGIICGKDAPVFECDFGTVACAICFDLNFDELRLQYAKAQPDLILFSSMYHGGMMQEYWAYSCRSYFVGAICGLPSAIIAPNGRKLAESTNYFDFATTTVNLDSKLIHLDENWGRISTLKEKYGRGFKMDDTGYLGSVLISSEHEDVTIEDMIAESGIELLDEYMQRSLDHRNNPDNIEK